MARKSNVKSAEKDSTYFLKLVLYIVVASIWLKFSSPIILGPLTFSALPLGLGFGLLFASHEHFAIDRKIEYAILLVMTVVTYFLPAGILL